MKKTFILLTMLGLVFAACTKETPVKEENTHEETPATDGTRVITITPSAEMTENEPDVKAVYTDGHGFHWTAADSTALGLLCGSSYTRVVSSSIAHVGEEGVDPTFAATVSDDPVAAYYPESAGVQNGSKVTFTIPAVQTQAAAGVSDDAKIALVSKSVNGASTAYTVAMKPAAALVRLIAYASSGSEGLRGTKLALKGTNLAGKVVYDFSNGSSAVSEGTEMVTLTLGTAYDMSAATSKETAKGIYLQLAPGAVLSEIDMFAGSKGVHFAFSSPVTIQGEGLTDIYLDAANVKGEPFVMVGDLNTLQATVDACSAGLTVRVGAGTLTLTSSFVPKDGVNVSGGWNESFTVRDLSTYKTVLDGGGACQVFHQNTAFENPTTVSGLIFQHGSYDEDNGGGAQFRGNLTVEDCTIRNCSTAKQGGGVHTRENVTMRRCTISDNTAAGNAGGVYLQNDSVLEDCLLENNISTGGMGGGLQIQSYGIVRRCIIRGNKALNGGGVRTYSQNNNVKGCRIEDCLICGNHSTKEGGSALQLNSSDGGKPVMVTGCTITGNVSDASIGTQAAVYSNDQKLYMANNVIWGNSDAYPQLYINAYGDNGPYLASNAITRGGLKLKSTDTHQVGTILLDEAPFGPDYKLDGGSALIDAGVVSMDITPANGGTYAISIDKDLAGNSRLQGTAPDLGCYETAGTAPAYNTSLRLATYNVRCLKDETDEAHNWANRKANLARLVKDGSLDVVGLQEVTISYNSDLSSLLGDTYSFLLVGRDDGTTGEQVGIAYKKNRFTVVNSGHYWLSPTPDTYENARVWGGDHNRIAVWALLREKTTMSEFYFCSTHLELVEDIREKSAALIVERAKAQDTGGLPYFLVGDFNALPTEACHTTFKTWFSDSFFTAESLGVRSGEEFTFNAWDTLTKRIDYIYAHGPYSLMAYRTMDTAYNGVRPSDHLPVCVEVAL